MFRWVSVAVIALVVLAAVASIAVQRYPAAPQRVSAPVPAPPPPRTPTVRSSPALSPYPHTEEPHRGEQAEREQRAYNAARGNRAALQAYADTCEICTYRDAALREKARLDAAEQEERTYNAARGNREALQAYLATCSVCAYRSGALEEKARIDAAAEQEDRGYTAARGNKFALQAYIDSCRICAHKAAAQSEIIAIDAAQPRRIKATLNICGRPVEFVIDATGVAEPYRSLLGVWTGGAWNARICGGLIVRRIENDGTADVVYIYGPLPGQKFTWRAQHPAATVDRKTLTFVDEEGSSFIFDQTYDSTLHGIFSSKDGVKLDTVLMREPASVP